MRYLLSKSTAAGKDLDAIDSVIRQRIEKRLEELRDSPIDHRSKNLRGHHGFRSARVGDWRILYVVDELAGRVIVDRIQHRKEVYRNLS